MTPQEFQWSNFFLPKNIVEILLGPVPVPLSHALITRFDLYLVSLIEMSKHS